MRRLIPYLALVAAGATLFVVTQIAAHHASCETDAQTCDVNYDGRVNGADLALVRSRFGLVFGTPTATQVPIATATATSVPAATQTPSPPSLTPTATAPTPPSGAGCTNITPRGALPPAVPIWCAVPLATGPSTFISGANSWLDDFNHGLSFADLGAGYVVGTFDQLNYCSPTSLHFRHNNHWMTDVHGCLQDGLWRVKGGAWMRPDRSFTAVNGFLVVEAVGAPDIATYDDPSSTADDTWMELVVTTAPALPGGRDGLYAYDAAPGYWTFGCRLQGGAICAIYDDSRDGTVGTSGCRSEPVTGCAGARRYEMSFFQCASLTGDCFGGDTSSAPAGTWKECAAPDDPDAICRNQFRLVLTATSVDLYVNGYHFFHQGGLPPHLQNLVGGQPVFAYFADVVFGYDDVARFHWDRLAINP